MSLSALRVLVVEDHGFQRRVALRLLADCGIEGVLEAADGASALELLERQPQAPDVILVDLDMPGMDGIEFIGHIAQRRLARAVALVSALDPALLNTVQTMARAYGLFVLGSVEKPLTGGKLQAVLAKYEERQAGVGEVESIDVSAEDMRAALAAGELVPWFQPQVEFGNGKAIGIEALARWHRADGQVVMPRHFIPVIEREGLADALTEAMLVQSCRWKRQWDLAGMRLRLSVNVSPATLHDPAAADHYQRIVQEHGVDPAEVVLEITESLVMADAARGLGVLARLRLKGFGLSIDDFGTGYSSLAQLSQVPFTELKIDQGFVTGAHAQPRKRAVVEASLDLARKLDLDTVGEGVETTEDWQMLATLGCSAAQGFLISPAVPGEELVATIGRWRRPN
jgi:EAL domain-containing protein (putative c-di-GMP-specific phosphodiesterase class I)/AmiR/NasT family two-component response regulator